MNDETPPVDGDGDGASPCAWCGRPVRQSGTGRPREYCRRSCRQRAYEERQIQQRIAVANQAALAIARDKQLAAADAAATDSSRDDQIRHVTVDGSEP
ncbi:hypothetical protein [Streptomyces cucumeris]|uniref:hypothetical protein n=1 Tax=Streptomyces cucumeris TaxID=2962890 RepID=UPI003D7562FB